MIDKRITTAKNLRKLSTNTENILWKHLRSKQLEKLRFKRQQPIGNYIVDFVCFEKRVVIEVDGGQHQIEKDKDKQRDKWFKEQGFRVLRFWNNEVLRNMSGVLEVIRKNCLNHPPLPLPLIPSHKGRGEIPSEGGGQREYPQKCRKSQNG